MSRVFKPTNCLSNGLGGLGSETKVWFTVGTAMRVSAHPEFGVIPNRNDNFAWVRHFLSC